MNRMNFTARSLMSVISFYLGWWACALGASSGYPWLGPVLLPIWILLHIYFSPTPRGEFLFFIALAIIGFAIDTLLIQLGLFKIQPNSFFAPSWLVSMWVLWGLSFESMLIIRQKTWLMVLTGGVSGPIAYFAGEALQILFYERPLWITLGLHGAVWAGLLPALFIVRDHCQNLGLRLTREP